MMTRSSMFCIDSINSDVDTLGKIYICTITRKFPYWKLKLQDTQFLYSRSYQPFFLYKFALFFLVCLFVWTHVFSSLFYYTRQWIFTPNTHAHTKEPLFFRQLISDLHIFIYTIWQIMCFSSLCVCERVTQLCLFRTYFVRVSRIYSLLFCRSK